MSQSSKPNGEVRIELSQSEALVLFDLLSRFEQSETFSVEHGGETVALWRLQGTLEKALVEPFRPDYQELVSAARDRLAELGGL